MDKVEENKAEIDENSLEWAKKFKKHLRFDVGDIVFLKSDVNKKCPMTVSQFELFDSDKDYYCTWTTSQMNVDCRSFKDKTLMV